LEYLALKFDIINSRKLPHRDLVQREFLLLAEAVNRRFTNVLAAKYIVTHGDEAQALLKKQDAPEAFRIFEFLTVAMRTASLRCGVGLGTLSTDIQAEAIGMDGTAWQNADAALETAKAKRRAIYFQGFEPVLQLHLNALGNLLCYIQSRWTGEQVEVIRLLEECSSQKEIAARLGVSEVAVSKRLKASGWQYYSEGRAALELLLKQAAER